MKNKILNLKERPKAKTDWGVRARSSPAIPAKHDLERLANPVLTATCSPKMKGQPTRPTLSTATVWQPRIHTAILDGAAEMHAMTEGPKPRQDPTHQPAWPTGRHLAQSGQTMSGDQIYFIKDDLKSVVCTDWLPDIDWKTVPIFNSPMKKAIP